LLAGVEVVFHKSSLGFIAPEILDEGINRGAFSA